MKHIMVIGIIIGIITGMAGCGGKVKTTKPSYPIFESMDEYANRKCELFYI